MRAFFRKLAPAIALLCSFGVLAAATNRTPARPQLNVKQAGAVGDGVSDDTKAIQTALTGGYRTVIIPSGTYKITAALKVDSHTTIKAAQEAIIRLADHAGRNVEP